MSGGLNKENLRFKWQNIAREYTFSLGKCNLERKV